jgi:NAD(P)-dependent dehydrogenase (short-subunit alcohol dehydrogenase family)
VNVNALQPGPRDTKFHADTPPEWWTGGAGPGSPDDVIPAAVYLAGLEPGEVTGHTIDVRDFVAGARRG